MARDAEAEVRLYDAYLASPDKRLIAPAELGASVAEIDCSKASEWRIWEGYLEASLILLEKALLEYPRSNNLIFPALFNLRHSIEIALKCHIRYAGGSVPKGAGHNLEILVETFRRTADNVPEEVTYISEHMLEFVAEMASLDPRSLAFRYPGALDTGGSPTKWDIHRLFFSAGAFAVQMDSLADLIDRTHIDEYVAYMCGSKRWGAPS